jgi:tagatose 6-phosphate kinase
MIVCVTPNAAIDLTMQLEELHIGAVQRVQASIAVAGGKGVNVARVLRLLGGDSVNAAFLGGAAGRYFVDLAEREGLRGRWTWVDGETRTCVMLAQPRHGDATVVNGQGMLVGSADWERLQHDVAALARESAASSVCLCGSLPPGSPVDAYERLIRTCVAAGLRTWVDTSGAALRAALGVAGAAIKVNRAELMHVLHDDAALSFGTLAEIGHAVRELIARHSLAVVAVTLGAEGAVLATPDGAWAAAAPQVPLVSSVGSGDAMLAGTARGFERDLAPAESLRCGIAAGSANAMNLGGGYFARMDYERILEETHVVELA